MHLAQQRSSGAGLPYDDMLSLQYNNNSSNQLRTGPKQYCTFYKQSYGAH